MATQTPKSRGGKNGDSKSEVIETRTIRETTTPVITSHKTETFTTTTIKPRSFQMSLHSSMGDSGVGSPGQQASAILHRREEERREMELLNDKFADYIMKVRFLQAQNRKLDGDINHLASKSGQHNIVKNIFEAELKTAKDMTDTMGKDLGGARGKLEGLQKEMHKMQERLGQVNQDESQRKTEYDALLLKLRDAEKEISFMRGMCTLWETDENFYKKQNNWLNTELQRVRTDFNHAMLESIDAKNQLEVLLEEQKFLRDTMNQELENLRTSVDHRLYGDEGGINQFRNDLALAIQGIKDEMVNVMISNKSNMESWYKLKVQEIQGSRPRRSSTPAISVEETSAINRSIQKYRQDIQDAMQKNQILEKQLAELSSQVPLLESDYNRAIAQREAEIKKLRAEGHDASMLMTEMADLNRMLREEIRIFRVLVQGAESTVRDETATNLVKGDINSQLRSSQEALEKLMNEKGETATRIKFQQASKGHFSITQVDPHGKFVVIENTKGKETESLENFKLTRNVDGITEVHFEFPAGTKVAPGKSLRINAKGGSSRPPEEIVADHIASWGIGHYGKTSLKKGDEEVANHIQTITAADPNEKK